jgi:carboxyl-terminal processing protease
MVRFVSVLVLSASLAFSGLAGVAQAQSGKELRGEQVASIAKTFLRNHYSQERLDDAHSARMLRHLLNRFDPGHFYFLQSDIDKFQPYYRRMDDLVLKGDIDIAFEFFERFRQRVRERGKTIERLLAGPFDLKSEDSTVLDRKNEPYPRNTAEAKSLWARKLKFELLEQVLSGTDEQEARKNLRRRYHSFRLQLDRYTRNDVITAFLNSLTAAYDPHSSYLSPDDLENFNISLRLSLEGIGATLRWEDGITVVTSIIPGGAAWRQGTLKPEDKIAAVAQGADGSFEDVRNMRLIDVVKLIRGKRGTTVRLAVLRKSDAPMEQRLEIAIVRDKIVLKEGEAKGRIIDRKGPTGTSPLRFGFIKLPSFYVDFSKRHSNPENYKSSSRDVERIVRGFVKEGVDGVILDLRNNGGGGLDEAVSLSGLFLKKGPVVMVKNVRGRISVISNPHSRPLFTGPLLVMTNRFSASASEILAGALKDYGRAILVGESSTFGKGTVQNIIQLPRGMGALKTTVAKFYRPGSSSTQNRGVVPDIVLPSLNNHVEMGEASLQNALPWDSIRKSAYQVWGDLSPYLPVVRERSRQRQLTDPDFVKVQEKVEEYLAKEKNRKVVTVSQMIASSRDKPEPAKPPARPPGFPHGAAGKGEPDADDFYIKEVTRILADYINLSRKEPGKRLATRKS